MWGCGVHRVKFLPTDVRELFAEGENVLSRLTKKQLLFHESYYPDTTLDQLLGRKQTLVRWLGRMARGYLDRTEKPEAPFEWEKSAPPTAHATFENPLAPVNDASPR